MKNKPKIVVLALGANDGLRGIKVAESEKNLSAFIELAQKNNIKVVLAGMQMPPNYGKEYTDNFKKLFPELAKKYQLTFIPFILEGVAGEKDLNLSDGIHPNPEGHKVMSKHIYKYIKPLL